jgi:hypothetical protein
MIQEHCHAPPADKGRCAIERTLAEVLDVQFHPQRGSRYWLEKERRLGIDARREIRSLEDLDVLGVMDPSDLRERSVWDFVPAAFRADPAELIVAETGGTLGKPGRTAFHRRDFHAAFVEPFVVVARALVPVPRGAVWAWIGPTGPHMVGKAAREVCRALGSPDPFTVDFDPRWFKAQAPGSMGRRRYLEHVVLQALDVVEREPISVLFSTPPVLVALGRRMPQQLREGIQYLHLAGLPLLPAGGRELLDLFPNASLLSGYGNSLLGVCPQVVDRELVAPEHYPHGSRLHLRIVRSSGSEPAPPFEDVSYGERGRVLATRLDPSFLIVNLIERDTAVRVPPPPAHVGALGFLADGLESPAPVSEVPVERLGIY